jgi:gliding motility-associated-like protein
MRWLIGILFTFSICFSGFGQSPDLRRICPNGRDNTIYWSNPNYPCTDFKFYIIWERKGTIGTFLPIDTLYNSSLETYLHTNATPPFSEPNSTYFIERRDSCGPDYNHYSDTLIVDVIPPEVTELDSVSIDITSNKVVLGWHKNPSPDFDKYLLYYLDAGFFVAMTPSETRDTFAVDLGANNPQNGSITYNINTRDSCGKSPAFEKRHSTIHLTSQIDTCAKTIQLTWTPYIGWVGLKKHYIFRKTNSGIYELIDSVNGNQFTYTTPILTGNTYTYFIRSQKDTSILVTSSSNTTTQTSRLRVDPSNTEIDFVSTKMPVSNDLVVQFSAGNNEEASTYKLYYLNLQRQKLGEISLLSSTSGAPIETGLSGDSRYLFILEAFDLCGNSSDFSDTSTNILLTGTDISGVRNLHWNPYFTWNTGVNSYLTYRGTGSNGNISYQNLVNTTDTFIQDIETGVNIEADGLCYYVEAIKDGTTISKSNGVCLSVEFSQFIPSAFAPEGYNKIFKPGGSLIDEKASTMKIYNRWGMLIYESNLVNGWDGKESNGNICPDGVYYYQIEFISTKQERKLKNGTFTLLR